VRRDNPTMSQTQQAILIEIPVPARCVHCASTQATVLRDREMIDGRFGDYPGWSVAPCCTPESDYRCGQCGSGKLQFAMHYASAEGDDSREVYRCEACGCIGDAEDAAPPVQPWAELAAVAEQREAGFRIPAASAGGFTKAVA
jgi:hypothetical protein